MLKAIVVHNFVHFKDRFAVFFESPSKKSNDEENPDNTSNSLTLFVGASSCGKSTVLELIRRCMTKDINVSMTSSFDENTIAYAFCKFELQNYGPVISGIIKEGKVSNGHGFHKVLIYTDERGTILRSSTSTFKDDIQDKWKHNEDRLQSFQNKEDTIPWANFFDMRKTGKIDAEHVLCKIKSNSSEIEMKEDELTWKSLQDRYVATMPLRGIGTVQWTKSKKIKEEYREENYRKASDQAEIISKLLSHKSIDKRKEESIFSYLTSPQEFVFEKEEFKEDEKVVVKINVRQGKSPPFPLLKTSVGILEAKQVSLLLAHEKFETICLEEPDRGMHPQMIERLKRVLYKEGFHKTIVVATHSPYFIDTLSIKNTQVFFRTQSDQKQYVCGMKKVPIDRALSKVHGIETYRALLFGTKILLVEGPTDQNVMQILFTFLHQTAALEIQTKEIPTFTNNTLDITGYQIIPVHGCQNADKFRRVCKLINLPCVTLLDRDKYMTVKDNVIEEFKGFDDTEECRELKDTFIGENMSDFLKEGFDRLSRHFQSKYQIFIWKYGDIEDTILSSESLKQDILKCLQLPEGESDTQLKKKLEKKVKGGLSREEEEKFSKHLKQVPEIERFLKYLEKLI